MKKKLLAGLLTGVLAVSMLAGCGGSDSTGSPSTADAAAGEEAVAEETAATTEAATTSDGSGTLTVWCWDPNYNIRAMEVAESIYQKDHPDFSLNIVETNQEDIMTKLATTATSGQYTELPDILLINDAYFQMNVASYQEAFLDLSDYGFDYDEFSPGKVGFSTYEGKNYGVPFDSGTAIACYRTDILEEAGYTIDDFTDITWDEWIEKAKDVLDKTGTPLLNGMSSYNQIVIMLQSAGGSFFNEDGTANIANNEILKKTVETYVEMVNTGVYTEETAWDQYIGGLNTGRIGGAMNGCWIMNSIEAAEDQSGKWEITNLPKLDGISTATNYSSQGGASWAVTSNCKDPALAMDFFKETFGGSTELYDEILPTGIISTWLPAGESEKYQEPDVYFSNQPVCAMITEYSANVPSVTTGVYMQNATTDVSTAVANILYSGGELDAELQTAEDTLKFEMEQ